MNILSLFFFTPYKGRVFTCSRCHTDTAPDDLHCYVCGDLIPFNDIFGITDAEEARMREAFDAGYARWRETNNL